MRILRILLLALVFMSLRVNCVITYAACMAACVGGEAAVVLFAGMCSVAFPPLAA